MYCNDLQIITIIYIQLKRLELERKNNYEVGWRGVHIYVIHIL